MADATLFSSTFTLTTLNSAKYDRVARLSAHTENGDTSLTLDVNTELFPCAVGDRLQLLLASTLALDGNKDGSGDGNNDKGWRDVVSSGVGRGGGEGGGGEGEGSVADEYDYVCYGKVYRFEEGDDDNLKVFVSFGGLLLYMEGPYKTLTPLRIDYVYLCLKK